MSENVKPKRRYSSRLRQGQAEQTQGAILVAARRLFVTEGWSRTTIAGIARAAGVSGETIYAVFGTKRALLERLVQDAVRGEAPETPLLEQARVRGLAGLADQKAQIAQFARDIVAVLERVAPLIAAARTAAESDPRLADLYRDLHQGRRRNLAFVAAALAGSGRLGHGLDQEGATDCLFRLASPEAYLLSRRVEGRMPDEIATWLESALVALLLPPEPAR